MGTLYIIGNGFDRHFGLKTCPSDFVDHLKKIHIDGVIGNAFDIFEFYGVNWSEYEQALNYLDIDEIELQNEIQPEYSSEHETDRDIGILNMQMYVNSLNRAVSLALENMVNSANSDVKAKMSSKKKMLFKEGDAVLSFNYTSTIEYLYFIPKSVPVYHIHGLYENNDTLIFGYKRNSNSYSNEWPTLNEENWDYYIAKQREIVYSFYDGWQKKYQINGLRVFLSHCHNIDRVVVLGHSMGDVDSEYMEQIEEFLCPGTWEISCHSIEKLYAGVSHNYTFTKKIRRVLMTDLLEK